MRRRNAIVGGVMLSMTLAACSATPTADSAKRGTTRPTSTTANHPSTTTAPADPTSAAPLLPLGVQGAVSAIPWARVGSGWLLALWGPNAGSGAGPLPAGDVPRDQETTSLFLVDPLGGRYLVASLPPPAPSTLAGWSGDGRRALVTSTDGSKTTVTEIDLTSGRTLNQFGQSGALDVVGYTRPLGLAVLATSSTPTAPTATTLQRFAMNGSLQQAYPTDFSQIGTFDGSVVPSPDGTQLVMGAAKGLALVGNDGAVVSQLPVAGATSCAVTRWWATGVALASCLTTGSSSQLFAVPISGAAVTTLTAPPVAPDLGDLDAWTVGNNVFLQSAGACGSLFLGELQPNGTSGSVTVPGVDSGSSVVVVGTDGVRLALWATVACGSGISAMWFNPGQNSTTVVLGPPVNGGGVIAALTYPGPSN